MSISRQFAQSVGDYQNADSMGSKFRKRRIGPLLDMVKDIYKKNNVVNIIDIGGREEYWGIVSPQFLEEHNVNITVVNLPGEAMPEAHGPFKFVEGNGCNLTMFADKSFHIAHSNSVLEHVGDWSNMVNYSKEVDRVSEQYFVQTPNYWFPLEPHCMTPFFHWLPLPIRVWLVSRFQLGTWKKAENTSDAVFIVESARLVNRRMFCALFPGASVRTERLFFLPKSFIAVKKAAE